MPYQTQVDKSHYHTAGYESEERFISYHTQKDQILKLLALSNNPKPRVLEIGSGSGFLSKYLKSEGVDVKTFDFDSSLNPDFLGDVRSLSQSVKEKFDVVACFETLEHIPFESLEKAFSEIRAVTSDYFIMSVPYIRLYLNIRFKLPLLKARYLIVSWPFAVRHQFKGEHYWELGKKGYSRRRLMGLLEKFFKVERDFTNPLNMFHHYFICKVK
jgi:hypothetical protein